MVNQAAIVRNNHLHINQSVSNCRAGSLPNVNHIGNENSIDLQSALNNLEDIRRGREPRERQRNASPMSTSRSGHHSGGHHGRQMHSSSDHKRQDASPYATPYLSPPDTWRRTNSDSALHQSAMMAEQQDNNRYTPLGSPASPRRALHQSMINASGSPSPHVSHNIASSASWDPGKRQEYSQYSTSPDQTVLLTPSVSSEGGGDGSRPKSCEVPGITIYPTQEDHGHPQHHIPLSSNTGSLPDLTNLHFPAPLAEPIDRDDQGTTVNSSQATSASNTNNNSPLQYTNPGPSSPYATSAPPPSPYSTTSNCGSPYSPQSPNSVNSTFSPPPVSHHLTGGVMYETTPEGSIQAHQLNNINSMGR